MTGTNIPEGHRRAFESLTRGDCSKLRDQAGIVADARLHDLRHSHASHAIMSGESLHVTGRLLGYRIQARRTAALTLTTRPSVKQLSEWHWPWSTN